MFQCPYSYLNTTFDDLADHLTEDCGTDLEKARACFSWLCSVDLAVLEEENDEYPEEGSPLDFLLKIKEYKSNHAHIYARLCRCDFKKKKKKKKEILLEISTRFLKLCPTQRSC